MMRTTKMMMMATTMIRRFSFIQFKKEKSSICNNACVGFGSCSKDGRKEKKMMKREMHTTLKKRWVLLLLYGGNTVREEEFMYSEQ